MKIGFNKETYLLAFDILVIILMIKALVMSFGYWLPSKPLEMYEIQSMLLVSLTGVVYLWFHQLFDKEEPANSS